MSPQQPSRIVENLAVVRLRIAAAATRAGRHASNVRLVAVTKYAHVDWVRQLVDAGVRTLGESRPQQLETRASEFDPSVEWHLIGHLQRNKVQTILPHVTLIHSVDSVRLLRRINEVAVKLGLHPRLLLEVNVSGEASKDGFSADTIERDWAGLLAMQPAVIAGLMTMAPEADDPEDARPTFTALRDLRDRLRHQSPPELTLGELSMGMSGDFEVAIEEGATLIRVGSALFEGMPRQ